MEKLPPVELRWYLCFFVGSGLGLEEMKGRPLFFLLRNARPCHLPHLQRKAFGVCGSLSGWEGMSDSAHRFKLSRWLVYKRLGWRSSRVHRYPLHLRSCRGPGRERRRCLLPQDGRLGGCEPCRLPHLVSSEWTRETCLGGRH